MRSLYDWRDGSEEKKSRVRGGIFLGVWISYGVFAIIFLDFLLELLLGFPTRYLSQTPRRG
jgi:hypothetical protein